MKTSKSYIKKGIFSKFRIHFRNFDTVEQGLQAARASNTTFSYATAANSLETSLNSAKLLEVYLFYPCIDGRRERRGDFRNFFRKLINIDAVLSGQPIFLERQLALRYSKFMGDSHSILKAYVAERAIESSGQSLALKKGFLTKESIHGCYPGWAPDAYFINPEFRDS